MAVFFIFLKQELFYNSKNSARFLQNILFFLICCTIFFILLQNQIGGQIGGQTQGQLQVPSSLEQSQFLTSIIIWFSLLFSILFANSDFLNEDYRDGTLEQMIIFCENLEVFIIAKIIATWIIFSLPILLMIFPVMLLMGLNSEFAKDFFILAFFASIIINFICAFCGSLNIAANKAPMITILALPLIIPVLLIACSGLIGKDLGGSDFYYSLKILSGIVIFSVIITTFATTKIVKILCE